MVYDESVPMHSVHSTLPPLLVVVDVVVVVVVVVVVRYRDSLMLCVGFVISHSSRLQYIGRS